MKKILTLLITLCSSVLLQGCVPLLIFGGVAVGGVVTGVVIYDHRDTKTMMDDHEISYQAESKLNANDEIKNKTHISVSVFNRVVLLVGQSPTPQLKQIAENLVKPIPKIKLFHSEITVENPISSTRRAQDSWITTKIKSTLLAQKGLSTTQVKIITEYGVVYIMGLGNRQQIDVITEKVRQTDGVKKVVKLVEYIN